MSEEEIREHIENVKMGVYDDMEKELDKIHKRIDKIIGIKICDNCHQKKQKFQCGENKAGNIAGFCSDKCFETFNLIT